MNGNGFTDNLVWEELDKKHLSSYRDFLCMAAEFSILENCAQKRDISS